MFEYIRYSHGSLIFSFASTLLEGDTMTYAKPTHANLSL